MSAPVLFANNAQTTLAGAITNVSLVANLAAGSGALFPNPGVGQYFVATLVDAATGLLNEIVHVTNVTGDTVTMVRAQEGTTAKNWLAGDIFGNFLTAGTMATLFSSLVTNIFNGGTSAGTAAAQTVACTPTLAALAEGDTIIWVAGFACPGAMTLQADATAATAVKKWVNDALVNPAANDFAAGEVVISTFDGTEHVIVSALGGPVSGSTTTLPVQGSVKNLIIQNDAVTPNAEIDVTADELVLEDGSGNTYKATGVNQTIDYTANGAGGLDTGALAISTWYYHWVIYNPTTNTVKGLGSLSFTAPTMPSGYTFKARVGANITDASLHFMRVLQLGSLARYKITSATNTAALPLVAAGAAGAPNTPTYVSTSLAGIVPPTATAIDLLAQSTGSFVIIAAPNNNYGPYDSFTNPPPINLSGGTTGTFIAQTVRFMLEAISLQYAATGSSTNSALYAMGWVDNNANA